MRVLMISPIPSHPLNQGNSAYILALGEALKLLGCRIRFVYVTQEGLTAPQANAMRSFWDDCSFVDAWKTPRRQSRPDHWLLDDFYVDSLDDELQRLFEDFEFDVCMVHYVWFSKAFLKVPAGVPRVLLTHDRFGDRHLDFLRQGQAPAWFYTSVEEEARGLARADHVVAIQDAEAEYFRSITDRAVRVLGMLTPSRFQTPALPIGKPRAGFVASANPTNLHSATLLAKALQENPDAFNSFEFVIGGALSRAAFQGSSNFTKLGHVDDIPAFYGSLGVAINPNVGGSGLKIKSVEALSYGLPMLGTTEAMLGLPVEIAEHKCASVEELVGHLQRIAATPSLLDDLRRESRRLFSNYRSAQWRALLDLFASVGGKASLADTFTKV